LAAVHRSGNLLCRKCSQYADGGKNGSDYAIDSSRLHHLTVIFGYIVYYCRDVAPDAKTLRKGPENINFCRARLTERTHPPPPKKK
jgi:hypothetical protein